MTRPESNSRRRWLHQSLRALAALGALPSLPALAALNTSADPLRLALAWDEAPSEPGAERTRCVGVWAVSAERQVACADPALPVRCASPLGGQAREGRGG